MPFTPYNPNSSTTEKRSGFKPYNPSQSSSFPTEEPEAVRGSFLARLGKDVVKGVANPFLRVGVSAYNLGAGAVEGVKGNAGKGVAEMEKARNLGFFGNIKPVTKPGLDAAGVGLELGSTVVGGPVVKNIAQQGAKGLVKQGVVQGAKQGAITGATYGAGSSLQKESRSVVNTLKDTSVGAITGGVTGGVLGGIIGSVSGKLQNRALRKEILSAQEQKGLRPSLSETVKKKMDMANTDYTTLLGTNKVVREKAKKFGFMVKEARKQGFDDSEINFLSTVSDSDKPVMEKMYNLTVKAQSDPRQIIRAGDVLGENVTNQVKQVINLNKQAGKDVDTAAKSLRGKTIDAQPLRQRADEVLSNLGITRNDEGLSEANMSLLDVAGFKDAQGKLDFSKSVFKLTPELQKIIRKFVSEIPDGEVDAYDLHIFKKTIDELVDYGTGGEGLKGSAANVLKSLRNSADELLDNTFDDYNKANTFYKYTRDYIESAKGMVGKKVDLSSKEGELAFGQALRSAFSNNKSRPNTLKFIEDTHLISKELGLSGAEKNLLDQALFVNMLEEIFGSEAATGLAGEVGKAISKAKTVAGVVRNPVSGGLGVIADVIEKSQNITPEAKKQILKQFLK